MEKGVVCQTQERVEWIIHVGGGGEAGVNSEEMLVTQNVGITP